MNMKDVNIYYIRSYLQSQMYEDQTLHVLLYFIEKRMEEGECVILKNGYNFHDFTCFSL